MATLSPWPTDSGPALDEIRRHLYAHELAGVDDSPDMVLELLGAASAALVEKYAPAAPAVIKNLSVIRCVQYLVARSGGNPSQTIESLGDYSGTREFAPSMISCLRHSGAMAVLSPFKIRRARPCEVSE